MIQRKVLAVKRTIVATMLVLVVTLGTVGQNEQATTATPRAASEWRDRIDLERLLGDSAALDGTVIIYRPSYRQTLFVFGTGKVILQTYPPESFSQSAAPVPTCTANASRTEITEVIHTMIQAHFFDLSENRFVDTGEQNSNFEFEKRLRPHYIIVDDGSGRSYRGFAEGTYRGEQQQIPAAFASVEAILLRLAELASSGKPCPLAHYREWRRVGRGELVHQR